MTTIAMPASRVVSDRRAARGARKSGVLRVPRRAVAALFLERQHLERPRSRALTATRLTRFAEDVGGIQLDTINVVDRAHYLTLWSRFGPYAREALDRMVYRRRHLYEYWAHAACLVPMSHVPHWRHVMEGYGWTTRSPYWQKWVRANRQVVDAVLEAIRRSGPLSNADFEHVRKGRSTGWWDRKPQAHALDFLWMSGQLAVHSRTHFQKRYDLAERLVPEMSNHPAPPAEVFQRWHTRQSLRGMGAATETDLRMYLTFPRISIAERRRTLEAMRAEGEVAEVEIAEGRERGKASGRWLILRDDLPALERALRRRQPSLGTTLLSPFDSLLWHRERVRALFGYDYRIEVYVPAPRRRHGYYSLPILHDGQLIGRLDPKAWREQRRLEVRSLHFEPWFAKAEPAPTGALVDRDAALAGVAEALASLASFLGADAVTVGRVTPSGVASALRKLVKSSPIPAPRPRRAGDIDGGDS